MTKPNKESFSKDYHYTILAYFKDTDEWQPAYDADDLTSVSVAIMELIMNGFDKDYIIVYDNYTCRQVTDANLYTE